MLAPAPGETAPEAPPAGSLTADPALLTALTALTARLDRLERAITDPRRESTGSNPSRDRSLDIYRRVSGLAVAEE